MAVGSGTVGAGGLVSITAGATSADSVAGGAVSITAGAGTSTTGGVGGAVTVTTGAGGGGASGALGLSTGASTGGAGGAITMSVGSGTVGAGGALTFTAGATSADSVAGGAVTITGGAGTSTTGGAGGAVNIASGTGNGGVGGDVTITGAAGSTAGNVIVKSDTTEVARFTSTGLTIGGSSCGGITKIYKGTITVDASVTNIATGSEADFSATLTGVADQDIVIIIPPHAATQVGDILWSGWANTDTVWLRVTNADAATAYNGNHNWAYVVIKMTAGTCA